MIIPELNLIKSLRKVIISQVFYLPNCFVCEKNQSFFFDAITISNLIHQIEFAQVFFLVFLQWVWLYWKIYFGFKQKKFLFLAPLHVHMCLHDDNVQQACKILDNEKNVGFTSPLFIQRYMNIERMWISFVSILFPSWFVCCFFNISNS